MVATAEKKVKEEVFMQGNGSEDCAKKQQKSQNHWTGRTCLLPKVNLLRVIRTLKQLL